MAKKRPATQQPSETEPAKARESISKSKAIRIALDEGFLMAKPGVAYIRKTFGIEVSPAVYSALKSNEKHKARAAPKRGKDMLALDDVKLVKELVDRHGAGAVLQMVELFEK